MTCERAWAELSAGLDGEQSAPLAALDEHLATCVDCRNRKDAAHRLTRRVRLTPAQAIPDRAPQIVGAVLADRAARRRGALGRRLVRGGLVAAAFAQSVVVVSPLVLGRAGGGIPLHASRELGVFNFALAVGFVVASLRPACARGMLPLVGVATGALVLLAAVDSAFGETTLYAELPDVIAFVGFLLLCWLARTDKTDSGGPHPRGRRWRGLRRAGRRRASLNGATRRFTGMATAGDAPPALAADRLVRTSPAVYAPSGPSTEHDRAGDLAA